MSKDPRRDGLKGLLPPLGFRHRCWACGERHTCISGTVSNDVEDGDPSICWQCLAVSVYDGHDFRRPTPEEQAKLDAFEPLQRELAKARRVKGWSLQ
jgi:hypothetical protein